ncbi:MAG: hypothetical protein ACYCX4_08470 [Bacillota bacterium]
MQPKVSVWIDARKEKIRSSEIKELTYEINNLHDQNLLQLIYQSIGYYVVRLVIHDHKLLVTYDIRRISPSFIDYLLKKKGIEFTRDG